MSKVIKTCIDRYLPAALLAEGARRAIRESPSNLPAFHASPSMGLARPARFELAGWTGKKWNNGRILKVRFLDGDPAIQAHLQPFAHAWEAFCNIRFEFGNDPAAEIRISFTQPGSWSYIGTDALTIPPNECTMNFGWLDANTPDDEYSRVVTHEFGHALACIHEHQSPDAGIPWNKEAVYAYYQGPPNNWSREQVDANLFTKYGADVISQFSAFDPASIMLYPIPKEFTTGGYEVGWNKVLSPTDKQFITVMYPQTPVAIQELQIDGAPVSAAIGKHGEEHLYQFRVAAEGNYIIETRGFTDTVMTLCGPDDQAKLVAQDDDSGLWWRNARIIANLKPGLYFARVRHHLPTGTGNYRIVVKTKKTGWL